MKNKKEPRFQFDGSGAIVNKKCSTCQEWKPLSGYGKSNRTKDGLKNECLQCRRAKAQVYDLKRRTRRKPSKTYLFDEFGNKIKKYCAGCGEWKSLDSFRKQSGKNYLLSKCVACYSKREKSNYENNKPEYSERFREYYQSNRDEILERVKKYTAENSEAVRAYQEKYRIENAEILAIKSAESHKKWKKNNPIKVLAYTQSRRAAKLSVLATLDDKQWLWLLGICNYTCVVDGCGKPFEHQDHAIPLNPGTHTLDNVQPLCQTHNLKKNRKYIDYRSDSLKRKVRKYMRSLGLTPLTKKQIDGLIADFNKEPSLKKRQGRPKFTIQPLFA